MKLEFRKIFLIFSAGISTTKTKSNAPCFRFECATYTKEKYYICPQEQNETKNGNHLIEKSLKKVTSSKEMVDFLKAHVHWNLQVYYVNNNSKINDNVLFITGQKKLCDKCNCSIKSTSTVKILKKYQAAFLLLGLLGVFGNTVAISSEFHNLLKGIFSTKENKIYTILVLNLSFADLLVGIYLATYSIFISSKISLSLCKILGLISVTSNQVSVTLLVLISAYRVYGIVFPYKNVHLKVTIIFLVFCWTFWIFVACIPAFNYRFFSYTFVRGIRVKNSSVFHKSIKFQEMSNFLDAIENVSKNFPSYFGEIISNINRFRTNEVLLQVLSSFGVVDFRKSRFKFFGYFIPSTVCTSDYLIANHQTYKFYALFLLFYNLTSFLSILVLCTIIVKHLSIKEMFYSCFKQLFSFSCQSNVTTVKNVRNIENQKIFRRLLLIIATDFICWVPISLMGICHFFLSLFESDCNFCGHAKERTIASTAILILLPINSILNPFIYTFNIWKNLIKKIKCQAKSKCFYR